MVRTKEGWIAFLQTVSDVEIVWLAPWMPYVPLLYQCGDKPWVQLPRLWGAVSYAPLIVIRQFGGKQFVLATRGLAQLEFENYNNMHKNPYSKISNHFSKYNFTNFRRFYILGNHTFITHILKHNTLLILIFN